MDRQGTASPGERGQFLTGPQTPRRAARTGRLVALAALLAVLAGCASIVGALKTSADLESAGYKNVSVNIAESSGHAGDEISVSYSSGPTGRTLPDAEHAEKIVWDTFPGRFSAMEIVEQSGGCAGPVCGSESDPITGATYAQLAAKYGPRPRGLNNVSVGHFGVPVWAIGTFIGLAVLILAAAVITMIVIHRRRPPGPPGPPGGIPPGWPPNPQPWPNQPGPQPWQYPPSPRPWPNPPGQPPWQYPPGPPSPRPDPSGPAPGWPAGPA